MDIALSHIVSQSLLDIKSAGQLSLTSKPLQQYLRDWLLDAWAWYVSGEGMSPLSTRSSDSSSGDGEAWLWNHLCREDP